jgi:hypothetical protein
MATATLPKRGTYLEKVRQEVEAKAVVKPDKPKKVKVKRKSYFPASAYDAAGKLKAECRLKEWPKDFDRKQHLPLRPSDFENEGHWLLDRADRLEALAVRVRAQGEAALKGGTKAQRALLKKKAKLDAVMAALKAQLAEQGVEV